MSIIETFLAETRALADDALLEKCVVVYRLYRSLKSDRRRYEECLWCAKVCEERQRPDLWDAAVARVKEEEAKE